MDMSKIMSVETEISPFTDTLNDKNLFCFIGFDQVIIGLNSERCIK